MIDVQVTCEEILLAAGLVSEDLRIKWPEWANIVFFAVPDGEEPGAFRAVLATEGGPEQVHAAYSLGGSVAVYELVAGMAQGVPASPRSSA